MGRRLARFAVVLAMVLVGLVLCIDVLYFARGSLEEFPTPEKTAGVRTVTAVIAALLVLAEVALWSLLRHLRAPHGPDPGAHS